MPSELNSSSNSVRPRISYAHDAMQIVRYFYCCYYCSACEFQFFFCGFCCFRRCCCQTSNSSADAVVFVAVRIKYVCVCECVCVHLLLPLFQAMQSMTMYQPPILPTKFHHSVMKCVHVFVQHHCALPVNFIRMKHFHGVHINAMKY